MNIFNRRILKYFFHRQSNAFLYTILVVFLGRAVFADTLAISPDSISLEPGESQTFSATGGTGVLHWMAVKGDLSVARRAARAWPGVTMDKAGQIEVLEGASVVYTAPEKWGTYSLAVTDEQAMAVAEIQVFDSEDAIVTLEILGGNRVLRVGERRALSLQAWLADLSQGDYTLRADWKSSHPSIVTVNHEGVLTALTSGTVTLFAQVGEHSAQIDITVEEDTAIGLVLQPSPVRLISGREHTLRIEQILQGNRQQSIEPTECDLMSDAEAIVRVNERAEVQGLSPGQAMIEVVCGDLKARVPVFVSSQLALQVSPEKLILGREASKPFKISWGMPPYRATAETGEVSGEDGVWHYKARQVGDDRVTITDHEDNVVVMAVSVTKELVLSPLAVDLSVNQSTQFMASGGIAPYTWQATAGDAKPTSEESEVIYTAPNVNGVHELTVIDQQGYVKTAVINVNAGLMATPRRLIMNPEDKKGFQVMGGTLPYKLSAKVGLIDEIDKAGRYAYQAPDVSGDYTITVRDAEGRMFLIAVVVQSALQVTPSELFLLREEAAELNISGGYGEYTLTALKGEIGKKGGKIRYQAPKVAGRDVITITDQAGAVVQVEVLVSLDSFYISPNEHYVLPEEPVSLRAWGGRPPYTWFGEIELPLSQKTQQGERIQFAAPKAAGEYSISIEDSSGVKTESRVVVYQDALQLAPEKLVLAPGEEAELQALLGVPEYTWSVQQGKLSAREGEKVMYTAPSQGSEDVIQVIDATGEVKILGAVITRKTVRDICDLYVGSDGKIDEADANRAMTDYFQKANWINRGGLYIVMKRFLGTGSVQCKPDA
jgi:hypothetical protein